MAGRYLCTGSQLGAIISMIAVDPIEANKLVNEIIEKQFVGNTKNSIEDDCIAVYESMDWSEE